MELTVSSAWRGMLCGDCDFSGFVSVVGSLRAARCDAGMTTLDREGFRNCSFADPSEVRTSVVDALDISRFMVGLTSTPGCRP